VRRSKVKRARVTHGPLARDAAWIDAEGAAS
jgi:hypothetical protein